MSVSTLAGGSSLPVKVTTARYSAATPLDLPMVSRVILPLTGATRRIWVEPKAVPLLNALAKKLGVNANFVGNPKAPKFDYY